MPRFAGMFSQGWADVAKDLQSVSTFFCSRNPDEKINIRNSWHQASLLLSGCIPYGLANKSKQSTRCKHPRSVCQGLWFFRRSSMSRYQQNRTFQLIKEYNLILAKHYIRVSRHVHSSLVSPLLTMAYVWLLPLIQFYKCCDMIASEYTTNTLTLCGCYFLLVQDGPQRYIYDIPF